MRVEKKAKFYRDQLEEWSAMQNVDANGWREADYDGLLVESEAGGFTPLAFGTVIAAESEFRTDIPNKEGSGAEGLKCPGALTGHSTDRPRLVMR